MSISCKSFPLLCFFYGALLQLAPMVLFPALNRNVPHALTSYHPEPLLIAAAILLAVGHAGAIILLAALGRRWRRSILVILFLASALAATIDTGYYVAYGSYPGWQLWKNALYAPFAVAGYAASGFGTRETITAAGVLLTTALVSLRIAGLASSIRPSHAFATTMAAYLAAIVATLASHPPGLRFVWREHSLPYARWYGSLLLKDENSLAIAASHLPEVSGPPLTPFTRAARHVVVIIVECLRPDRVPVTADNRITMPKLLARKAELLSVNRAYAHAPNTESSFPIIFTSTYLPGLSGAQTPLWSFLKDAGVRTAFISSGEMRWGFVDQLIRYRDADVSFVASDAAHSERLAFSSDPSDFSIDDRVAVQHFKSFLQTLSGNMQSFSVLHLDSPHYPYQEPQEHAVFSPSLSDSDRGRSLGEIRASLSEPQLHSRVVNSYDNSLRFADENIDQVFSELSRLGILDDSLVIVTSDHGEAFGEHDSGFHGTTLYEEQVRVPLILRIGKNITAPKELGEGTRVTGLIDLIPSTLHALGLGPLPGAQGVSLFSDLKKSHELLLYSGFGRKVAIIKDTWKYIFDCLSNEAFFFDLRIDPHEARNLWTGGDQNLAGFLEIANQSLRSERMSFETSARIYGRQ
jgi:glucan phosphoethanolaminetransferase (alkaline phosphatase superfamily)